MEANTAVKKRKMKKDKIILNLNKLPKNTFEIEAKIPWEEVKTIKEKVINEIKDKVEVKGFRKGKAPQDLIISNYGEEKFLEQVLQEIITEVYPEAVQKFSLHPVVTPKVELISAQDNKEWILKFTTCEEPAVDLGQYKEEIKKLNASQKIWVPGQEKAKDKGNDAQENDEKINQILNWLIENTKVEISDLILETETNHKLIDFLEELRKLDISLSQYLASTGKTPETLKNEFKTQAEKNIKLQMILKKIADTENIVVNDQDFNELLSNAKTEEEKKTIESQKYYLAPILRQQKTLDFLVQL